MKLDIRDNEIAFGSNLSNISVPERLKSKISTGIDFLDSAYGGKGLTPGTVTLFTGVPGAGKTTLMLTMCEAMSKHGHAVIFNTAEESPYQIKMHADRMKLEGKFAIGQENIAPVLTQKVQKFIDNSIVKKKETVLVIDSLQTLSDGHFKNGKITSNTAVRSLEILTNFAKSTYTTVIVIGQVNKDGQMSGKQALKHIIDAKLHLDVIYDEKHPYNKHRRLFMEKNRFGGAGYTAYLKMNEDGFEYVDSESAF